MHVCASASDLRHEDDRILDTALDRPELRQAERPCCPMRAFVEDVEKFDDIVDVLFDELFEAHILYLLAAQKEMTDSPSRPTGGS